MAVAASIALARPHESIDDGWTVAALATAVVIVLVTGDDLAAPTIAAVVGAAVAGGAIGRWRDALVWAPGVEVAALVATGVVFAALPDTEGSSLLGAALVPVAVAALVRRTWWRGTAAGAAVGALVAAVAVVAAGASADRTGALVATGLGALVCAGVVVVVLRVLVDPARPVTSERARPSP